MDLPSTFILKLLYENISENVSFPHSVSLVDQDNMQACLEIPRGNEFTRFRSSADLNQNCILLRKD